MNTMQARLWRAGALALCFLRAGCGSMRKVSAMSRIAGLTIFFGCVASAAYPQIYVSTSGDDGHDGLTWATARKTVAAGVTAATLLSEDVWIAAGTYDISAMISLPLGMEVYGGFPATGDPNLTDRDPAANPTTLDGLSTNRIFECDDVSGVVIDGIGFTRALGGGTGGGAIRVVNSAEVQISRCTFLRNSAQYGAGVYIDNALADITRCVFDANNSTIGGGAVAIRGGGRGSVVNSLFANNSAGVHGGAVDIESQQGFSVMNCTFANNTATTRGGGIFVGASGGSITNCIFSNNGKHAIYKNDVVANLVVEYCLFFNNADGVYFDPDVMSIATAVLLNAVPGGTNNLDGNPIFWDAAGGNFHILPASPAIDKGTAATGATVAPSDDFDGDPRDALIDIGFDELFFDVTISRWDVAEVCPNPVGKLEAGQLLVSIEGTGSIDTGMNAPSPVFIVPQGGDPSAAADRIYLREFSYTQSGPDFVWTGTNQAAIPRIIKGATPAEDLLLDGHAAVYIDLGGGEILGDDVGDPGDDGVIQTGGSTPASEGRHFLIDTVPPRLQLNPSTGHLRGDDFVNRNFAGGIWTVNELDTSAVIPQDFPHPYDVSGLTGTANGFYDAPFDGNWMQRGLFPDSKAQVFFNVSSLTNNFAHSVPDANGVPTANLRFTLSVTFEDVDVYTAMGMVPPYAGRNADFFGGSTIRQVAGFTGGDIPSPPGSDRDSALTSGNRVLIQWDFQSTPFRLPEFTGVSVEYSSGGPLAASANTGLSPNLAATPTLLRGTFDIGNASNATTGVQLGDAGVRTMMSVIFRAVDRAGDYTPLSNATPGTKKLYTRNDTNPTTGYSLQQQPEVGPLNLWWLRTTATRLISNIPASGDTRAPSFTWENTGEPDPGAFPDPGVLPDPSDDVGSERLYSYAIYRTVPTSGTRDEQRDGPYYLVGSLDDAIGGGINKWSSWLPRTTLTALDVQDILPNETTDGAWFLLVVMSCDEAGNIELWPETQLDISESYIIGMPPPLQIDRVDESGGAEERNWERWFVPPSGEAVDTRIEPFFWHDRAFNLDDNSSLFDGDGLIDPNTESSFADAEVIPYPPRATFSPAAVLDERVAAQIRVRLLTDAGNANADWNLLENGVSIATGTGSTVTSGVAFVKDFIGDGFTVVIPRPANSLSYLGVASRQPTYYVFRARTFIDNPLNPNGTLDSGEIYDTSPATVQFVVVDNVANYIQNRKSEDTQPIQEMDRP